MAHLQLLSMPLQRSAGGSGLGSFLWVKSVVPVSSAETLRDAKLLQ